MFNCECSIIGALSLSGIVCENLLDLKSLLFNSGTSTEVAVLNDGTPKLDDCSDEYYKWEENSKGYSSIIKIAPSFNEANLEKALKENLEVMTEIVKPKPNAKDINEVIQNSKLLTNC
jgi:hypothetical protein